MMESKQKRSKPPKDEIRKSSSMISFGIKSNSAHSQVGKPPGKHAPKRTPKKAGKRSTASQASQTKSQQPKSGD